MVATQGGGLLVTTAETGRGGAAVYQTGYDISRRLEQLNYVVFTDYQRNRKRNGKLKACMGETISPWLVERLCGKCIGTSSNHCHNSISLLQLNQNHSSQLVLIF